MTFWQRKLLAYLHDPPHKPVSIAAHEDERASFLNRFGLSREDIFQFERANDWQAAAADRLIFPDPAKSGLRVDWGENLLEFRHPLGGSQLKPAAFPPTAADLEGKLVSALDGVAADSEDWKRKFILAWRLWPERAAREKNPHFAYLVADTRIPDHTLWHHNALASALTACAGKPAFLLFQIGPVQEFIAQARKTQDLWSGSYLLSFLISQAMLAIADEGKLTDGTQIEGLGPDAIVFPQLRSLPLADYHWWKKGYLGDQKLRASHTNELLTPNLPNRFLALVPADQAENLARAAEQAVRQTWRDIAEKVKAYIASQINDECPGWDKHWEAQVNRFLTVDWVAHPWTETDTALAEAAKGSPPLHGGWAKHPLHLATRWAEEFIPAKERESFGPRSNSGFAWSLHFAATDWKFAARKNARTFAAWKPVAQSECDGVPKDHLDAKNEVLGGAYYEKFRAMLNDNSKFHGAFKGSQLYGAISVIKRLWPEAYLKEFLDLDRATPVFQPVDEIAQIDKAIDAQEEDAETYYAVLAMDGDDMGQWVSGVKAAPLINSLAVQAQDYLRTHWPGNLNEFPTAAAVPRPLSPGYHAALSESLANFSLYCARPIVEAFGGQLIYAGGDDVLAMTPASNALDCAQALQIAFRGVNLAAPEVHASSNVKKVLDSLFDYSGHTDGFLTLRKSERAGVGRAEHLKPNWPLMVMGPKASVSVGIAIGHVRSPMQDVIQAARGAEKAAKQIPDKGAFCIQIMKRSGETVGFSARWQDGAVAVWEELRCDIHDLSGRFAYRYANLIKALVVTGGGAGGANYANDWDETLKEAAEVELRHVLRQQGDLKSEKAKELATRWSHNLIPTLRPRDYLHFWLTWAFITRLGRTQTTSHP